MRLNTDVSLELEDDVNEESEDEVVLLSSEKELLVILLLECEIVKGVGHKVGTIFGSSKNGGAPTNRCSVTRKNLSIHPKRCFRKGKMLPFQNYNEGNLCPCGGEKVPHKMRTRGGAPRFKDSKVRCPLARKTKRDMFVWMFSVNTHASNTTN
jgi:hypothetical protein